MSQLISILGAGESGIGAALLARQKGFDVWVSDFGAIQNHYKKQLIENHIPFEENNHDENKILSSDFIIKSPGVPEKAGIIKKIRDKNIPIYSEIEFASQHTQAKIIGITGSNGKTTTTLLTYHLLKEAGLNVGLAGNIGNSFAALVVDNQYDYYVLEISSFQLDDIETFRPDIAILLNITPDHLDRYNYQFENYIQAKFNIIRNQKENDIFIYNKNDININNYLKNKENSLSFKYALDNNFNNNELGVQGQTFDMSTCSLKGGHNFFNASCAIQVAMSLGIEKEKIQEALKRFKNAPHRLEWVANINGVDYINDSKATNVDSTYYALKAQTQSIIWIAGGTDKGNDYSAIDEFVKEKVKALICLGIDNSKLLEHFSPFIKIIEETKSAEEAIKRANIYAENGDVVLLSPACASFDLFNNYEHRGDLFRDAVLKLKETIKI